MPNSQGENETPRRGSRSYSSRPHPDIQTQQENTVRSEIYGDVKSIKRTELPIQVLSDQPVSLLCCLQTDAFILLFNIYIFIVLFLESEYGYCSEKGPFFFYGWIICSPESNHHQAKFRLPAARLSDSCIIFQDELKKTNKELTLKTPCPHVRHLVWEHIELRHARTLWRFCRYVTG